jgi:hypothetical protein
MTTNFAFLPTQFRTIAESAARAEGHIMGDPRAGGFRAARQRGGLAGRGAFRRE